MLQRFYKKTSGNSLQQSKHTAEKAPSKGTSLQPFRVAQIHKAMNYSKT